MNSFLYKSEFYKNAKSEDIVYHSDAMDTDIRITKEQFFAENPELTESDYEALKSWSDRELKTRYLHDRSEGRRHCSLDEKCAYRESAARSSQWVERCELSIDLQTILTPKQYHRFILYTYYGLSTADIAFAEGCSQQAISYTIEQVRNRLKKYYKDYL